MKRFRKVLIVFFCMVFIISTCVIPSSAACNCGEQYYMYDTIEIIEYVNSFNVCYAIWTYDMVYCRNCGDQWSIASNSDYYPHNFEYGRCVNCGYLQ